jgi:FKBP-type peptidyl-prolyl cis-trans isomerase 2
MAISPISENVKSEHLAQTKDFGSIIAESTANLSIPFVDNYYGITDGIIDPTEYSFTYTDPVTGVRVYAEHNDTVLYMGLEARTSGWIGFAWKNYTDTFRSAGLNNSDVIVGYSPGAALGSYWRVQTTDAVTVHYVLTLRNGTVLQESDFPDSSSVQSLAEMTATQAALQGYIDAIVGMRIGETRHFVIPANKAYTDRSSALYGQDLIYDITLTRIYRGGVSETDNPADQSQIVFSDEHGTSTFQHIRDSDQSRVLLAAGTDNGTFTQLEYAILLNSTDTNDIPLFNSTDIQFPFIFMFGNEEQLNGLPVEHTYWADPALLNFEPNAPPALKVITPEAGASLQWIASLQLNATDDWVTSASYRFDQEDWDSLEYNFRTGFWESKIDLSTYSEGAHMITFNATDISNATAVTSVSVNINRPFLPLLGMKVDVSRKVTPTNHYGSTVVDDYAIVNNGSAPINSIDIYLPKEYASNFLSMVAVDSDGNEIVVVQLADSDGMLHWKLYFRNPIGFQEEFSFTTTMYMTGVFYLTIPTEWEYRITFMRYPYLPYVIRRAQFALTFQQQGSLVPNEPVPDSTDANLAPFSILTFSSRLRLFYPNVVSDRTTRITVGAWGWLSYRETITITNTGANPINTFDFVIPAYSTSVSVYDEVGILAQTQKTIVDSKFNETKTLIVSLSSDRFGQGLQTGFKYTFTVDYVVQTSSYQEATSKGNKLDIPIATITDILVRKHVIDVDMSPTVALKEASAGYRKLYGIFDVTLQYSSYNTTQRNPISLEVFYTTTLGAFARPAIFSLLIGLIGLIYVTMRKVELPEEVTGPRDEEEVVDSQPKQTGAPPELLSEFATLYSKKTGFNMDLEKLDAARRRGKVKKREYMIRERDLKKQIEEIDDKLPSLRAELIGYGAKYRNLVGQLELQDEKIEGAKAGLRQLLLRKKKQRISRVAFEKSRQDYLKTIQKATSASDRILLSLQEEAGDI